jgi:HAD superfamily hydrolase (TIGR01549 family)
MSRKAAAVIFDMDGTIFDSTSCVTSAYRDTILAGGGEQHSPDAIVAAYSLGPPSALLAHFLKRPASAADHATYLAALRKYATDIVVYEGVHDLLASLASNNVPIRIFTGASGAAARQLLGATNLLPFFPVVVGGDEVERSKPAPDGILRACELLGVRPVGTAYVGDSPLDLEAAQRSGAVSVAARWGHLFEPAAPCDFLANEPRDVLTLVDA